MSREPHIMARITRLERVVLAMSQHALDRVASEDLLDIRNELTELGGMSASMEQMEHFYGDTEAADADH